MPDLENVIKGLETSLSIGICGTCVNECWYGDTTASCHDIIQDALALLKMRKPRVMALEEVRTLQDGALVWLEDNDKADVIPGIVNHVWNSLPNLVSFTVAQTREVKADMLWHGVKWRCWTSRPTDEQREAVKWE